MKTRMIPTAALTAMALVVSGAAHSVSLEMTNEYEANSIHGEGDRFFADRVGELSGGEVEIVLHPGGALGLKSKDHLDAVSDGVVPIADTLGGALAGAEPLFLASSLPFLAQTPKEARELYLAARPAYERFFAGNNQLLLYASPWPPSGIWAEAPVDTADKIAGLKIRTYDANGTRTFIAAGASPIQLSWADVVPQLATGGIAAVLTSAEGGVNASFWEHLNAFTEINYAMPLNFVHMSRDSFDSLTAEQQDALMNAAQDADARNWKAMEARVQGNYKTLAERGVEVAREISPEARAKLAEAAKKVSAEWLEKTGANGRLILDDFGKRVGREL